MTKLIGCVMVYNNRATLQPLIESGKDFIDEWIFADGLIIDDKTDLSNSLPLSEDDSMEFCKAWGKTITCCDDVNRPGWTKWQAREKMLNIIDPGDWMFFLRGDEKIRIHEDQGKEGWKAAIFKEDCDEMLTGFLNYEVNQHIPSTEHRLVRRRPVDCAFEENVVYGGPLLMGITVLRGKRGQ